MKVKRVLLKVSGEALMGDNKFGIKPEVLEDICLDIKRASEAGIEICLVIGGGNIFRGIKGIKDGIDRSAADYMGMLATVMNALALQNGLQNLGLEAVVQSAIRMPTICESYMQQEALKHMSKGAIVIFAAGTGNPFFTTDTAAALRAVEMKCDLMLKGTLVDGVYDADPNKVKEAKKYNKISYDQIIRDNLKVMDLAAVSIAKDHNLPILVFSIKEKSSFSRLMNNIDNYNHTLITN